MKTQKELLRDVMEFTEGLLEKADEDTKAEEAVEKSTDSDLANAAAEVAKTVSTTNTEVTSSTSGTFVQREHLDKSIADITERNTPLLDQIAKTQANGLTHEWDMITALGSNDTAVAECGTPPENEATIQRYSAQVKTYATRVEVCDLAQWASSDYVDLQNLHLERGMRKIIQDVEKKLYYGNHSGGSANDITGAFKLITDHAGGGNNIAAGTATVTQTMLDDAIQAIVDNGGMPGTIAMGAKDLRDFAALWSNKVVYNDPDAGMTFGYNVARYMSYAGPLDIYLDPFLTAANSPSAGTDIFVFSMKEMALAQTEAMYKLPTYRALTLAETELVVWNIAYEMRIPQWQAMITNLG